MISILALGLFLLGGLGSDVVGGAATGFEGFGEAEKSTNATFAMSVKDCPGMCLT